MRTIERTTQFKKDFKREMKGRHRAILQAGLTDVLRALASDTPLAENYRDHPLSGEWPICLGLPISVFRVTRHVVLVHGCFWHGHNCPAVPARCSSIPAPVGAGICRGSTWLECRRPSFAETRRGAGTAMGGPRGAAHAGSCRLAVRRGGGESARDQAGPCPATRRSSAPGPARH